MTRSSCFSACILLIGICFISSCNQFSDAKSPKLIFQNQSVTAHYIYVVDSDGKNLTEVGEFPLSYKWNWLSPNGRNLLIGILGQTMQVVEIPSGKIVSEVQNIGATNLESISYQENVSWSPDENQIVFIRESENKTETELVLFDLKTNIETLLTNDNTIYRAPVWSPNGDLIAAVRMQPCTPLPWDCPSDEIAWQIVVIDPRNGKQTEVTQDLDIKSNGLWQKSLCNLIWSPDNRFIVFENDCDAYGLGLNKSIFITSIDGNQLFQVINSDELSQQFIPDYSVQWLDPSSTLYVGFSLLPYDPTLSSDKEKSGYLMYIDDNFETPIIRSDFDELIYGSHWSPSGSLMAAWQRNDLQDCEEIRFGELNEYKILLSPESDTYPLGVQFESNIKWSADNKFLAYTSSEKDVCDDKVQGITVVVLDTNLPVEIASNLDGKNSPIGWFKSD